MTKQSKASKNAIIGIVAVLLILGGVYWADSTGTLKQASVVNPCGLTVMGISNIKTISNEPTLNNEKAYLIEVAASDAGECLDVTITQDDLKRFGIDSNLYGNLTLSAQILDAYQSYRLTDDTPFYKIFESTVSCDTSGDICYDGVSLLTTQKSAIGQYQDPNGQAPKLSHLGNFPSGGDVNTMRDITKLAYVMPEASNIPLGKDASGNWHVTHFGGVPYALGRKISTLPINNYQIKFTLSRDDQIIDSVIMTEQEQGKLLGGIARINDVGGFIKAVFPSQPGVDYAILQGIEGTPVAGELKFVDRRRYDEYLNNLDMFVNFDNNYFEKSWSDMTGELRINSTPAESDIFIDNKYIGFTPLIIPDFPIGQHVLTAKKNGFVDYKMTFNVKTAINKIAITLNAIPPPPPPPPAPSPPVRRDPGVGREAMTSYENNLNNMLGLMYADNVAPEGCTIDSKALTVRCKPQYPVTRQVFQILLRASDVGLEINSGITAIDSVTVPERTYAGDPANIIVKFSNTGTHGDGFNVYMQSEPKLSEGAQQFTMPAGNSMTASIPFSGSEGTYKAKVIVQSLNNPAIKVSKDITISIIKKPLPDEIKKLQGQTSYLENLILSGQSDMITAIGAILGVFVLGFGIMLYQNRKKK